MTLDSQILHATTVAVGQKAVMITGPSGAGKSALALQMIALGAVLVADDKTQVRRDGPLILASVPAAIAGRIEARGIGILQTPQAGPAQVALVVDLEKLETRRLPERRTVHILGVPVPCLHKVDSAYFPSALVLYMKSDMTTLP